MSKRAELRRRARRLARAVAAEETDGTQPQLFRNLVLNRATRRRIAKGGHGVDPRKPSTWRQFQ